MGVVVYKSLAQAAKLTDFVEPVQMRLPKPPISPRAQIRTGGAEIGGRSKPHDSLKPTDQPAEKKKGFTDWMSVIKPGNEEKDHWLNSKITDEVLVLDEEGEDSLRVVKKICDPFSGAPNYNYAPENCSKDSIPIGVLPSVLQDSLVITRTQESAKGMGNSFWRSPI
ncbi:hypothetical protein U1Q18_025524 [Sarracenia purpurea var. burkii]